MKKFRQAIAVVVALSVVVSVMLPVNIEAANSIYEYTGVTIMAGETAPIVPEMSNGVTYEKGSDYCTVTTVDNADPYFSVDTTDVTLNNKTLAIKYRASADTFIVKPFLYPETTAGGWGESYAGILKAEKLVCSGEWHLVTYNINTELLGVNLETASPTQLSATIKSLRIGCVSLVGGTFDIAYVGVFNSTAEAETYDAMFSDVYTSVDTNFKAEVVPEYMAYLTNAYYDLNDSGVSNGASLCSTSYTNSWGRITNPLKATWTPRIGINGSTYVVSGSNKYLKLHFDSLMNNERYANDVPYVFSADILPGDMAKHFSGFVFNYGYENDGKNNIFFETNKVNGEASVAKSGIGVSIYPTYMEVFVLCVDENTGNLSQITHDFPFDSRVDNAFHSFKAVDNAGGAIRFYFDGKLVATVSYSGDKVLTGNADLYSERYYRNAGIYDSEGTLVESTSIAVISYTKSIAMGSRARIMNIDNVCLETPNTTSAVLTLDKSEYDADSNMIASVSYNNSAVVDSFIAIYNDGDSPENMQPVLTSDLKYGQTADITLDLSAGSYFAVLMGKTKSGNVQYGSSVAFTVIKTGKSFVNVDDTTAKPGSAHKVTLSLPENQGISYMAVKVTYDENVLTLTDSANGAALDNAVFTAGQSISLNPYILTWASASNIKDSGVIAELTFDVSETAEGSSEISVEIIEVFSSRSAGSVMDAMALYEAKNGVVTFDAAGGETGGDSGEEEETNSLKLKGARLELKNDISILFLADKATLDSLGYVNLKLKATYRNEENIITPTDNGTEYVFKFENICPHEMNELVTAVLVAELEGVEFESNSIQYSVAKYAYSVLGATDDSELQTLLVDMLRYGSAAQIYMGYSVDNLVDSALTDEQASWGSVTLKELKSVYETIPAEGDIRAQWKGASLLLDNNVEISTSFEIDNAEGVYVNIYNENGYLLEEFSGEELTVTPLDSGNVRVSFVFNGLNASQMRETVKYIVYDNENRAISDTLMYSIESYAFKLQNEDTALADLIKAMMMYGDSASAYVS